jgi:hypothetical protein
MRKAAASNRGGLFVFGAVLRQSADMTARLTPLFAIALFLLAGCDSPSPQGLKCGWSAGGLFRRDCEFSGGDGFQGLKVGMEKRVAFGVLCAKPATFGVKSFMLLVERNGKHGRLRSTRTLRCSDWIYFQQSDYWMLTTTGAPCSPQAVRPIVINILDGRMIRVHAWCLGRIKSSVDDLSPWNWL